MKTLQEFYTEVLKSEELKKSFAEAVQGKTVEDFLKKNGCEASAGDVEAFLKERQAKTGELSDDELDNVSGGCHKVEAIGSAFSLGLWCAMAAIESAVTHEQWGFDGKRLCDGCLEEDDDSEPWDYVP